MKLILSEYIKNNVAEKIEHCEVVFTIYREKDVIDENTEINEVYNDRDFLLSVCGYIESEYNLNDYFDEVFEDILNGKLKYSPSISNCDGCYNAPYCEHVYQKEE
ncbi:hypothetical protein [Brachyspira murdochii]|uniref:hypothetical protein n=1 Tax=Brachyspira murdochii TaxID=84378 RepID=UPI0021573AD8|nr:hypothetical protein [Brachyspira murdochii]